MSTRPRAILMSSEPRNLVFDRAVVVTEIERKVDAPIVTTSVIT